MSGLSLYDEETDPQLRPSLDQAKCQALKVMGRWDEAYAVAMQIDHLMTAVGVYEAAQAAAWTRSLDRIEEVARKFGENQDKGVLPEGLGLYIEAIRSALSGDREHAAQLFVELIDLFEPVAVEEDMAIIRTTFAMLVGQDNPAAARAAQLAHDWLTSTGTTCFFDVWADGLPDEAQLEAPAVG
jgi:hypothetical protein